MSDSAILLEIVQVLSEMDGEPDTVASREEMIAAIRRAIANAPISGEDAERIRAEIRDGTPDTPERIETIRRADETFARSKGSIELHRELAQERIDAANRAARDKERPPAGRRSEGGE